MDGYARRDKVRIEVLNRAEEREHFHQDIELLYILEGSLTVEIGEQKSMLGPEDIFVVNANKKHSLHPSKDILYVQLLITYQLVSDVFQSVDIIFWCDSTKENDERYDTLRRVLKQLLDHYLNTRGNKADFGHIALCYQVMELLSVHFLVQAADKENMDEQDRFEDRILQINNYIRANYNQQISLKDLADRLFLSNGYLSRFFKQNYGMSFAEYLSNIRLYHAVDELLYTDTPITRIAYDNGFASVAVFNKTFKKMYGETPSSFRKKSAEEKSPEKAFSGDKEIERRLESFLAEEGFEREEADEKNRLSAEESVLVCERAVPLWNGTRNIGAAEDLLRSEIREHVILLKEALGVKYVRFWNIFSEALLIDIQNQEGDYNFSRLDSILDFLLQQGLKPHIELGQKPKRIHRNVQESLTQMQEQVSYTDRAVWKRLMEALMKHLMKRYGQAEVDQWRMELWWDERFPKDSQNMEAYFSLFDETYGIVKKYSSSLEVGGCGFRGEYEMGENSNFLAQWKKHKCQPDFLSMLLYAYIRGEENQDRFSRRNTDNEAFLHNVEWMRKNMEKAGMKEKKLYITEWNLTISDRNYINDTCFKGAYIVKNILDLYGEVEEAAYFSGSDRISEYYDSHSILHGGTGLLTRDGILKPAGFAFEFLNRMYPYYVGKGSHYLVTADGHGSYGIICHNQRKLNYNYYFTKEDELEKEHIWKYYEGREAFALNLKLKDLENGAYQLKVYRINEKSGSVLNIWKEMEYARELEREDIKYFRRVCEPKLSIQEIRVTDGAVQLEILLSPNEIAYIRVRKMF